MYMHTKKEEKFGQPINQYWIKRGKKLVLIESLHYVLSIHHIAMF